MSQLVFRMMRHRFLFGVTWWYMYACFYWATEFESLLVLTSQKSPIRPVWSESSLSTWRYIGSLATHWAHCEDWSDLGGWSAWSVSSLGAQVILLVLSQDGSFYRCFRVAWVPRMILSIRTEKVWTNIVDLHQTVPEGAIGVTWLFT